VIPVNAANFRHPGIRRDDGRENEFNALIAAKMAAKICESDSDFPPSQSEGFASEDRSSG
jgi:hypothetical protein